jgi:hypothetical protein
MKSSWSRGLSTSWQKSSPTRQALQSPRLDTVRLAPYYLTHIRGQTHDLSEWFRIFALINLTLKKCQGFIDLTQVEAQQLRLEQPLRTPSQARSRLRFESNDPSEEEEDTSEPLSGPSLSSWDQIPKTPAMSTEGFSTQEERHSWTSNNGLPADLVRTIHSLQTGLAENANGLLLMHREVTSRWLLTSDDLKLLQGQQAVLKSQVAAQAATSRDGEGASSKLKEMQEKVSNVLSDLAQAEQRLKDLEAANVLLENKDKTLEHRVDALQTKEGQLSEQLVATLLLVRDLKASGLPPPLLGENHFDLTEDGQETLLSLSKLSG